MKIIIDGKEVEAEEGKTILEIARENKIFIPSLCDHPRLAPFTGCRLCIVEIKGRKGFPPSCGTYGEEGMEIKTKTPSIQKLRRQILELILSEHPNACLICSEKENCDEYKSTIRKVGEVTGCVLCSSNSRCELQDIVGVLKIDKVNFPSLYRNYEVKRSDSFFDRNYNLCILCGRCVRVCHEVRGASAISFVYRGSEAVVGSVLDRTLLESGCQFCGACVDICPTGALAERGLKYETLPEETKKTICALCGVGCELKMDLRGGRILSSQPVEEGTVNQGQACVRGRFTIRDLVYDSKRILTPLIKRNKEFEEVSWEEALGYVAQRLKKYRGREIGLIASSQVSCEDGYLFYKFARNTLKTKNVSSSARYSSFESFRKTAQKKGLPLVQNFKIDDISQAETLFLIDEEITVSHPIIWLEVLKAVKKGANLLIASTAEASWSRFSSLFLRLNPGAEFYLLCFLSKFIMEAEAACEYSQIKGLLAFKRFLNRLDPSQAFKLTGMSDGELRKAANILLEGKSSVFLFGAGLSQSISGKENLAALWNLALQTEARLIPLGLENNLRGIAELEKHFGLDSLNIHQILQGVSSRDIKALYLAGPVPCLRRRRPEFLVVQDSFISENSKRADVIFPAATFVEREGTFVNIEGRMQKSQKVIEPRGEAKPDWWIVSRLGQKMGHGDFEYKRPSNIMNEIRREVSCFQEASYTSLDKGREIFLQEQKKGEKKFISPGSLPEPQKTRKKYPYLLMFDYSLDYFRNLSLAEEIGGLRRMRDSRWIKVSLEDAEELNLKEGESITIESSDGNCNGVVKISASIPKGAMKTSFLWSGHSDFSGFPLLSSFAQDSYSLGPIPVRIKRGK